MFNNQIGSLMKKDLDDLFGDVRITNKKPNEPPIAIVQRDDVG